MEKNLTRHGIVKKIVQIGFLTSISKFLGLFREVLLARFLGVNAVSDAFFAAYRLPSSLRKIFAEGALNAAIVPTAVGVMRDDGKEQVGRLVSLLLLVIQTVLVVGCAAIAFYADSLLWFVVPGWSGDAGITSYILATRLLRVLIFFIAFVSAGVIFTGAFQVVHSFSMPTVTQVVTNALLIVELLLCNSLSLSVTTYAVFLVGNSFLVLLLNCLVFYYFGFKLSMPNRAAWHSVWQILRKFVPCAIGLGAIEINLFIDQAIASYLPEGSVSLMSFVFAFARFPLGIFAGVFAAILLPHFSRVSVRAPKRLSFYLLESAKFIWWVTIPATFFMMFFAEKMFSTLMLSSKFTATHAYLAGQALTIFTIGLFVFSLEKVVLNMFYALHETRLPTIYTLITTALNTGLTLMLIPFLGVNGIVLAVVVTAAFKMMLFIWTLRFRYNFNFHGKAFLTFLRRASLQLVCGISLFLFFYGLAYFGMTILPPPLSRALLTRVYFWVWVCPLCGLTALFFYFTRRWFGIRLHFLD